MPEPGIPNSSQCALFVSGPVPPAFPCPTAFSLRHSWSLLSKTRQRPVPPRKFFIPNSKPQRVVPGPDPPPTHTRATRGCGHPALSISFLNLPLGTGLGPRRTLWPLILALASAEPRRTSAWIAIPSPKRLTAACCPLSIC